jgi:hypothetical protein
MSVHLENSRIHALTPKGASFQDGFQKNCFLKKLEENKGACSETTRIKF